MRYEHFRYLFPPRPQIAAAPTTLRLYEEQGWLAQAKFDGTNCVLYVPPLSSVEAPASFALGRHGAQNRLKWQPDDRSRWLGFEETVIPGDNWTVLCAELLHTRGTGRDTVVLHDILVDDGDYLVGSSYAERYKRLERLCAGFPGDAEIEASHSVVCPGVWLASLHKHSFSQWYAAICAAPEKSPVEGIVLKDPAAKLALCGTASANSRGMHKCRRPTAHLSF